MPHNLLKNFCPPVILTALDAGDTIAAIREEKTAFQDKHLFSLPGTAAKAAGNLIMQRLQMLWDLPVISADTPDIHTEEQTLCPVFWMVEPLDGKQGFCAGNSDFTVNIALMDHGEPVFGVVYAPAKKTLYFGASCHGARKAEIGKDVENREELAAKLTDTEHNFPSLPLWNTSPHPFTVVTNQHTCDTETTDVIERLEVDHGPARRMTCTSSLRFCMLAEGTADVCPQLAPSFRWQTAAAHAILIAAGGALLDYTTDTPLTYDGQTFSNPFFIAYNRDFQ